MVLESVGRTPAYEQAYGTVRPGGVISRVGVPQYENAPVGFMSLFGKNVTLTGGSATVRAYLVTVVRDAMPMIIAALCPTRTNRQGQEVMPHDEVCC